MANRREFLKSASFMTLGALAATQVSAANGVKSVDGVTAATAQAPKTGTNLGFQAYSLGNELLNNPAEALKKMKSYGYDQCELAFYGFDDKAGHGQFASWGGGKPTSAADFKKMADDAVSLIKLYKMEDECVLISLKYDVIDYIETQYPEMQTGFLTFASFGNTAGLNCDYLALEEESATTDAINSIHEEGKQVIIWTANEKESQRHFLCSDADGIITDNVVQAMELITELENRSDLDRMVDKIKTIM